MTSSPNSDQPPSVGIIIPTYGQWEYAKLAVESASLTPGAVIIVVDDGSPTWPGERVVSGWVGDGAPFAIQRYFGNRRNLSRSWNTGIEIARGIGCGYVVCGNSDLVFPRGWWEPIRAAIDGGASFAGPITNAPGHVRAQDVSRHLPSYDLSDDPDDIKATQRKLLAIDQQPIEAGKLNGFCFAGSIDQFTRLGRRPFDETIPLLGNEDDFFRRATQGQVAKLKIVTRSFVFHYRSVTLGLEPSRPGQGAVRLAGCAECGQSGRTGLRTGSQPLIKLSHRRQFGPSSLTPTVSAVP